MFSKLKESTRWKITFAVTLIFNLYILHKSYKPKEKRSKDDEAWARLLNFKANGYKKDIGNPSSPNLFELNFKEVLFITFCSVVFYYVYKSNIDVNFTMTFIRVFVIFSIVLFLLFSIPINDFHTRFLYNLKNVVANVVQDPGYELFMGFLFIVVLPLPGMGKKKIEERSFWLATKLGTFLIWQGLFLGPPKYNIPSPEEEPNLHLPQNSKVYYILTVITAIGIYVFEKYYEA